MSGADRPDDSFEQEVRAAFGRHLAELDRHVPKRPPAVCWSDRVAVEGRVSRRAYGPAPRRLRRSALPQLAGALGAVGVVAVFALVANLAMHWVQSGKAGASEAASIGTPSGAATAEASLYPTEPASEAPSATASAAASATATASEAPSATASEAPSATASAAPSTAAGIQVLKPFSVVYLSAADLSALAPGYAHNAYVVDRAHNTVLEVPLGYGQGAVEVVVKGSNPAPDATVGAPRLLASGGCLLVLDDRNQMWEWCNPSGSPGYGSLDLLYFSPAGSNLQISAFAVWPAQDPGAGYSLMTDVLAVEPARGQIVEYPVYPGSGRGPTDYLARSRDLSQVTDMCVKGNAVFLLDRGSVVRIVDGQETDWQPQVPGKAEPYYSLIASGDLSDADHLYLYDRANRQLVVVDPADGSLVARYQAYGNAWAALEPKGMIVTMGLPQADGYHAVETVYWIAGAEIWGAGLP